MQIKSYTFKKLKQTVLSLYLQLRLLSGHIKPKKPKLIRFKVLIIF